MACVTHEEVLSVRLLNAALIAFGLVVSSASLAEAVAPTASMTNTAVAIAAAPSAQPTAGIKSVYGVGQPVPMGYALQPQVTKNGVFALWMHDWILMPIITAISLFVLALLVWVAFRYRRAANPVPSKTTHNTTIEVVWTLAPVLILVGIAIPSIGLLAAQYKPVGKNAVTIKATGNQWYWSYTYPDNGDFEIVSNMLPDDQAKASGQPRLLAVDNRIVVPVGVPIRVLTTSADVIHSWALPAFWTKMDAVPGRINETSFTVEKAGVYYGQCTELCGARHGFMPIAVEAVSPAQFASWIASKGGHLAGAKPAATKPVGMDPPGAIGAALTPAAIPNQPQPQVAAPSAAGKSLATPAPANATAR